MKRKIILSIAIMLISGLLLAACGGGLDQSSKTNSKNISAEDIIIPDETGPIVWNGDEDKELAFAVDAQLNTTRKNAGGIKITSNAHSDEFPGIYFIWDSKQKDNGYLKVSAVLFTVLESFVITTKEANSYWDFFISPQAGQQITDDNCYVFYIPKVNNNKNINMVFIDEWTLKEQTEDPVDNITVSVSIDYELNGWDGDILVRLTLSEGEWDNFILWPDYGSMSNTDMAAEKAAISQWITISYAGDLYSPFLRFVGGGYDYIDIRTSPLENPLNNISVNEKVLIYRFMHGYSHVGLAIGKKGMEANFSKHFPFIVTLNEEKLDEMKAKTDITGNLTIGTKTAVLDKLKGEGDTITIDIEKSDIKYLRCSDYLRDLYVPPMSDAYPLRFLFKSLAEFEDGIAPLVDSKHAYAYTADGSKIFQLAPAVNDYGDVFFNDYNLVMVHFIEGSGGVRHEVDTAGIKANELNLVIKRDPRGNTMDMAYWFIFIPIKKDIFNGDSVNIEIVNTLLDH